MKLINHLKKLIISLFLLYTALLFTGCNAASQEPISKTGFYFDTVITVTLYDAGADELLDDCFALADKYEKMFSATIDSSDISKINQAGGKPVTVSGETLELIQKGLKYGELSEGRFDITIGKLSLLWNFSENEGFVPDSADIAEAVSTIDYRNVTIDGSQVTLLDPDSAIDLGGIAKGYIADRMKEYLVAQGVTSGTINLGGNVLVIGEKPGSHPLQHWDPKTL